MPRKENSKFSPSIYGVQKGRGNNITEIYFNTCLVEEE
jgi:hypothetical protein